MDHVSVDNSGNLDLGAEPWVRVAATEERARIATNKKAPAAHRHKRPKPGVIGAVSPPTSVPENLSQAPAIAKAIMEEGVGGHSLAWRPEPPAGIMGLCRPLFATNGCYSRTLTCSWKDRRIAAVVRGFQQPDMMASITQWVGLAGTA